MTSDARRTCTIDGCDRPYRASGYCNRHYHTWWMYGDPLHQRERPPATCTVDGCDGDTVAKGLCAKHYQRERARLRGNCSVDGCDGDAYIAGPPSYCRTHYKRLRRRGDVKQLPGDHGDIVARIDAQSVGVPGGCIEWTSRPNSPRGYGRVRWGAPDPITGRKKYHLVHRVAWALWNDVAPEDMPDDVIRHLCNNAKCVNPLHLERGTHSDNAHDAVRAGQHPTRRLSRYMADRLRSVALRHGVPAATVDAIVAELSRPPTR